MNAQILLILDVLNALIQAMTPISLVLEFAQMTVTLDALYVLMRHAKMIR